MLEQKTFDWLRLALIPEIGARRGKRLLEKFKTPAAILNAPLTALAEVEEIGFSIAKKIVAQKDRVDLTRQLKAIEESESQIIPLESEFYPAQLKAIFDPPLVLFVKGNLLTQDYFSLSLVGTRMSSFYGRAMAEKLSSQLVQRGFTIVSGGARGIDTFSHQAALKAGGRTIAVLGCGLDIVYPPENKKLFTQIAEEGALVSEFPLGTPPNKQNFPLRNRIISGLSLGVVVVEAPPRSGALITATSALEQGRQVFSVPGKADSFTSKGTHQLLREGAKLVESVEDIIEELEPLLRGKLKEFKSQHKEIEGVKKENIKGDLTEEEERICRLLSCQPLSLEELVAANQIPLHKIYALLTRLELKKIIRQSGGQVFALNTISTS